MPTKLGVIAGGGDLPVRICEACEQEGRPYFVVAIEKQADVDKLAGFPHSVIRLGAAGKAIKRFKEEGVVDLVMAGRVTRPSLAQLRPDAEALKFFSIFGRKLSGDDALLSRVANYFHEKHGFNVVSVSAILGRAGVPEGVLTDAEPTSEQHNDIERGVEILRVIGPADVGQAVVVQEGMVLGVEAIEGTDSLIERCGPLQRSDAGAVLVKATKPNQDSRVDMPTIGVETVRNVAAAGFSGIAIEAEKTIVVDTADTIAEANRLKIFLMAVMV